MPPPVAAAAPTNAPIATSIRVRLPAAREQNEANLQAVKNVLQAADIIFYSKLAVGHAHQTPMWTATNVLGATWFSDTEVCIKVKDRWTRRCLMYRWRKARLYMQDHVVGPEISAEEAALSNAVVAAATAARVKAIQLGDIVLLHRMDTPPGKSSKGLMVHLYHPGVQQLCVNLP